MEFQYLTIQGPPSEDYTKSISRLGELVRGAIGRGWVPNGPITMTVFPTGFLFVQSMLRMPNTGAGRA